MIWDHTVLFHLKIIHKILHQEFTSFMNAPHSVPLQEFSILLINRAGCKDFEQLPGD